MTTAAHMSRSAIPGVRAGGSSLLETNLSAFARLPSGAAAAIRGADDQGLRFVECEDGVGMVDDRTGSEAGGQGGGRALTSLRRPVEEGREFAEGVELAACVVVIGFGAGHHIAALANRVRKNGIILVFEPDLGAIKSSLSRIDLAALRLSNVVLATSATDGGALAGLLQGAEGLLAMGVRLVEHVPSKARLRERGNAGAAFIELFTQVLRAVRTNVVTTLVQARATIRNLVMNADHYGGAPGIADLKGAAQGRPAVVVAAGPSLARNIDQLKRPGLRDRCIIIGAQTVLRTLLKNGIRPHFITALDHHEISRRFYEGLTEDDVRGITLVMEPKANAAIAESFPGGLRCVEDRFLNDLLGPVLEKAHGALPAGATVAHLAYYLARHLGCDPVILAGQDLGFTDGQYYAAGAAIHDTWAGELNGFNTLEMLEWQRIVRGRAHLRRLTDQSGRPIYTDEQMATYLVQFERDFRADVERPAPLGPLTVIDATEGGVAKAHTIVMPLSEALDRHAPMSLKALPDFSISRRRMTKDDACMQRLLLRLSEVSGQSRAVAAASRRAGACLAELIEHHHDQTRVNRLIGDLESMRDEVQAISPGYRLVQHLNQTGAFNRSRRDRAIHLDATLTPIEKQRRQLERDAENVDRIAGCADELCDLLDESVQAFAGNVPKRTRDPSPETVGGSSVVCGRDVHICALVPVRLRLASSSHGDTQCLWKLGRTVAAALRCAGISRVVILTDDASVVKGVIGDMTRDGRVSIRSIPAPVRDDRSEWMRAARFGARDCWRGGLGNATVFDELLGALGDGCLGAAAAVGALEAASADAALLLDWRWHELDAAICEQVIARYSENPRSHRFTFSQSPPGPWGAPCLVERSLLQELAKSQERHNPFASLGGLLAYIPTAPTPDLIVRPVCVPISPERRDATGVTTREPGDAARGCPPAHFVLEVGGEPLLRPPWLAIRGSPPADLALIDTILESIAQAAPGCDVTFGGGPGWGDPLAHPNWCDMVRSARDRGLCVHLRTAMAAPIEAVELLAQGPAHIVSVDLMAVTPATYETLTGRPDFQHTVANIEKFLHVRLAANAPMGACSNSPGFSTPRLVVRLTRCDAVYQEIEAFYDRFVLLAGCAVIDPLPRNAVDSGRIRQLPLPRAAAERAAGRDLLIGASGQVFAGSEFSGLVVGGAASADMLRRAWECARRERARDPGLMERFA